jgi:hypothetical protein
MQVPVVGLEHLSHSALTEQAPDLVFAVEQVTALQ